MGPNSLLHSLSFLCLQYLEIKKKQAKKPIKQANKQTNKKTLCAIIIWIRFDNSQQNKHFFKNIKINHDKFINVNGLRIIFGVWHD